MMIILLLICCCVSSIIAGGVGYFITQTPKVEEKEEEEEEEEFDYKASEPETVAPEVVTVTPTVTAEETTPTFTAEETTPTVTAMVLEKVNCGYSSWTNQGTCSNGKQKQTRTITTQPKYGGTACDNSSLEREVSCGQNCVGAYGDWTACTKVCGGGKRTRLYTVSTPASGGGVACPTDEIDVACNTQACPKYKKQNAMYYKSPSVYVNPTTGATTLNMEEAKMSANSNKDCLNTCTKHSNCGGFFHHETDKYCTLYKSASDTKWAYHGMIRNKNRDVYKKVGSSGMPDLIDHPTFSPVIDVVYDGKA